MSDPIHNPAHYQAVCHCPNCGHAIEAISITERFSFVVGNALKYLLRAGRKDGADTAQDYGKAAWYATRAAEQARRAAASPATAPSAHSPAHDTRQPTPGVHRLLRGRVRIDCDDMPVTAFRLEGADGPEYWMGLKNFYAITRYNRSVMYAMAVHQLSDLLVQARGNK